MAKKQKKLGWVDAEELVFLLIDRHPQVDPRKLSNHDLVEFIKELPEFSDRSKPEPATLEEIATRWYEERVEMEDELGPLREAEPEETLDEDEYRDDREAVDEEDEESETLSIDELEEDEDEDEEDY